MRQPISKSRRKKKKQFKITSFLQQLSTILAALILLFLIGLFGYFFTIIFLALIESDNIKKNIQDMIGMSSNNLLSAFITSILLMIGCAFYLLYSIGQCKKDGSNPSWLSCDALPFLDYNHMLGIKLAIIILTTMGIIWSVYLHYHQEHIKKWKKIILIFLLFPIILIVSSLCILLIGTVLYLTIRTPRLY